MDAIPSLCASTAICGAAIIGCTYGRVDTTASRVRGGTDGHTDDLSPPPRQSRPSIEPFTTPETLRVRHRPHSATVSTLVPRRAALDDETLYDQTQSSKPTPTGVAAVPKESEDPSATKLSWVRRVSTIAQSRVGGSPTTLRSNSPLQAPQPAHTVIDHSTQVTPGRNKLVKRSTSLRILHPSLHESSPFSASHTPTFRRPATSHQRSEQLRFHQLQQGLELPPTPTSKEKRESENHRLHVRGEPVSSENTPTDIWQAYFHIQPLRYVRNQASKGNANGASDFAEELRCAVVLPGGVPALIRTHEVAKPQLLAGKALSFKWLPDEPEAASSAPIPSASAQPKLPRSRHSLSLGDIMSTPPSARKLRRGESLRKSRVQESSASRRTVSAPQHNLLAQRPGGKDPEAFTTRRPNLSNHPHPSPNPLRSHPSRTTSSPLPPLKRLSALDMDLLDNHATDDTELDANRSCSPLLPSPSPGDLAERVVYSSIRFKPRRTSRIPSDRASTAMSSDNEHSRVFSTDGDDIDYRSETVYDSIRTDATSSSHSGAKIYRADSVFGGAASPEPLVSTAGFAHERLAQPSGPNAKLRGTTISEEAELMQTPISVRVAEADTPTPAPRLFPLMPADLRNSSISTGYVGAAPIDDPTEDDTDVDEFWSIHEDVAQYEAYANGTTVNPDEAWTPPTASGDGWRRRVSPDRRDLQLEEFGLDSTGASNPTVARAHDNPPPFAVERGSRSSGRRATLGLHLRSQSVPLSSENSTHRFNNTARLDAWILGGKGVSEDWDGDFEFDEGDREDHVEDNQSVLTERRPESGGMFVPHSILERQASVHGQFGQVKELTQLVEELRRLWQSGNELGLLHGQASELWREAEGIIDLATLDEGEGQWIQPQSPQSSSFDFDAFEDDPPSLPKPQTSSPIGLENLRIHSDHSSTPDPLAVSSSPMGSNQGTPQSRPRKESVARAKHVLENIHQHRNMWDPRAVAEPASPRKLHFDTTSLRDLVTRTGVVTRALQEIVRRTEDPDRDAAPERGTQTPPDPPFSQIFHPPPATTPTTPPSRRSPRTARRRSSNSFLNSPSTSNDGDRNGHRPIMSVV